MRLDLTGLKQIYLHAEASKPIQPQPGWVQLEVCYCAICRTDAKIWTEGHRDLVFPRVPGHEMVVRKDGQYFAVWPGVACGTCEYCLSGDENLCEEMRIIGFHHDGGFSDQIVVPETCLVPIPTGLSLHQACFAEPAGCVMNAFKKLSLKTDESILIIGGGTVGLLTALLAKQMGAIPTVLEKNESKIRKANTFCDLTKIPVIKETNTSGFNCVINTCADPLALMSGITRLAKAGRMVHFSGLVKNEQLETNLLNLIHYKELRLSGSYGLTKADMRAGLILLKEIPDELDLLIEGVIEPAQVEECMQEVIDGTVYKYIINLKQQADESLKNSNSAKAVVAEQSDAVQTDRSSSCQYDIPQVDKLLEALAQEKIDHKTKPLGALGTLEKLAIQISRIQNTLTPVINKKTLLVFAADHGIAEEGVSTYPQEVTGQMVKNFLNQGAAINVLCKHHDIDLSIVDVGVNSTIPSHSELINKRVANGTNNFALQTAMSKAEVYQALKAGAEAFNEAFEISPISIVGLGEMGIANTTSATAIISTITGQTVRACTGRGTGVDDQALDHKVKVIEKALAWHQPNPADAMDVLMKVGGFEIAAMAGAALAAASKRCAVVLDGLISTSAGLVAYLLNPEVGNFLIAGHKSVEKGHVFALEQIGIEPVLDLQMRLGEGTGAALSINLVEAASKIMCDMASFDEAGVSTQTSS